MISTQKTSGGTNKSSLTTGLPFALKSGRDPHRAFRNKPFLVIDWLTTGVVLSEVTGSPSGAVVKRSHFAEWPDDIAPLEAPESAGQWLKTLCETHGFSTSSVAVSVPRREVSLKLLELPNVSEDDLGPLVSLQVESRIQVSGQSVLWDCLSHESKPEDTLRYVALVTVPEATTDAIRLACRSAGCSNVLLTTGDLAIYTLDQTHSTSWQLYVQANPVKLELLLCRRGVPAASSATAMPPSATEAAELIRTMASRLIAGTPAAWHSAETSTTLSGVGVRLRGSLAHSISAEISSHDVQVSVYPSDHRTTRSLAVATALHQPNHRIDFLNPRSADGRLLSRKKRRTGYAVAAFAAGLIGSAGLWMWHSSLESELSRLNAEGETLRQITDRGQDTVARWSYVSRWQNKSVNGAVEIRKLATLLPERDRMIVTRLQLENGIEAEAPVLRIDGLAERPEDVLQLSRAVLEHASDYDLRPHGIEPAPAGSPLNSQFRMEAVLRPGSTAKNGVR